MAPPVCSGFYAATRLAFVLLLVGLTLGGQAIAADKKFTAEEEREYGKWCKAAADGDFPIVQRILQEHPDWLKQRPLILFWAAHAERDEVLNFLIDSGGDIAPEKSGTESPLLWHCAILNRGDAARRLIKAGADISFQRSRTFIDLDFSEEETTLNGESPLDYACRMGAFQVVEALLEAGAELHTSDRDPSWAIHYAARGPSFTLGGEDNRGNRLVFKQLLKAGAKIDEPDMFGDTPLMHAVMCHQEETVKHLLENHEVRLNLVSRANGSLMHIAVGVWVNRKFEENAPSLRILKLLIERGVPTDLKDKNGKTPLDLAPDNEQLKTLLIQIK